MLRAVEAFTALAPALPNLRYTKTFLKVPVYFILTSSSVPTIRLLYQFPQCTSYLIRSAVGTMGIPYLFTDIEPYCEVLRLGDQDSLSTLSLDFAHVNNKDLPLRVVIDGPCLVHSMYSRLIRHQDGRDGLFDLPTYWDVQDMCHGFLNQLEAHNVDV